MAQTTGQVTANNVFISLGGQDISGSSNRVSIRRTRNIAKTPTFDGDNDIATAGRRTWSGDMRIVYTEVTNEGYDELWTAFESDSAVPLVVRPKGTGAPNWEFTGNVFINALPFDADKASDEPLIVDATFEGSGDLNKAAQT